MSLTWDVISIGALGRNRLWDEAEPKRPSHATTTLVRDGTTTILIDPALPEQVLAQRLEERTGLKPDRVDVVMLTAFRPAHRRALSLFDGATWFMHQPEIDAMVAHLEEAASRLDATDRETRRVVEDEQALLDRMKAAPDKLAPQVHLFPAPGTSPGSAALLLAMPTRTVIVAGDAVLTRGHAERGRVFEQSISVESAMESFTEIMEIADEVVPGHDNAFTVAGR